MIILPKEIFEIKFDVDPLNKEDPISKLSNITDDEINALNSVDIYTISDLANEEDLKGLSKITKLEIKRIDFLNKSAHKSLKKKK